MRSRNYELLSEIYYNDRESYEQEYSDRFAQGIELGCSIDGYPAFYVEDAEIFRKLLAIERINSEITGFTRQLPGVALKQYEERCLIDEIILTNDIGGVYCSRREISTLISELTGADHRERTDSSAVLSRRTGKYRPVGSSGGSDISAEDEHGIAVSDRGSELSRRSRFGGLVRRYTEITGNNDFRLRSSRDIRDLYDEMIYPEVLAEYPGELPDGEIFRKGSVTVLDPAQRVIHEGVLPESRIIEQIEQALNILGDENTEPVVRTALFHYLLCYIHPFYRGNGRMSRFISSYMIGRTLNPLVSSRLSAVIREDMTQYYKAFRDCNSILNRGDLTPFVLVFTDIVYKSCIQLRDDMKIRTDRLRELMGRIGRFTSNDTTARLYYVLIQAALFSESGISTGSLLEMFQVSRPTLQKRLGEIDERGLLRTEQTGKNKYYRIDIERM